LTLVRLSLFSKFFSRSPYHTAIQQRQNNFISREYGALSDTTKLLFWYLLAQGMDRTEIMPMPANYTLEPQAAHCLQQLQQLQYAEQITMLRDLVAGMGVDPSSSPHDSATGL
jgi:Orange carotenoid protein, N-terminal